MCVYVSHGRYPHLTTHHNANQPNQYHKTAPGGSSGGGGPTGGPTPGGGGANKAMAPRQGSGVGKRMAAALSLRRFRLEPSADRLRESLLLSRWVGGVDGVGSLRFASLALQRTDQRESHTPQLIPPYCPLTLSNVTQHVARGRG